jgi:hypothetical protein
MDTVIDIILSVLVPVLIFIWKFVLKWWAVIIIGWFVFENTGRINEQGRDLYCLREDNKTRESETKEFYNELDEKIDKLDEMQDRVTDEIADRIIRLEKRILGEE